MDEKTLDISLTEIEPGLVTLILVALGGMLFLSLLVIFFYIFYRRRFVRQAQQLNFYEQKLLDAEIITQETERNRIATDLHDVIGSLLSATKMFVGKLDSTLAPEKHLNLKGETIQIIDQTIQSVRQIIHDILPINLTRFGLSAVLENLFDTFNKVETLTFTFTCNQHYRFDNQKELVVYRIVQELVNNSLKHAEATHVELHLQFSPKKLSLHYTDDGKGFDVNAMVHPTSTNQSLGLKSIRSRIAFLQADYELKSAPSAGFSLSLTFEIDPICL